MSVRVKRSELEAGRWYIVRQGSVMRQMRLDSWSTPTMVNMTTRQGGEREVSTLKIVEGWNQENKQIELLPKAGEPEVASMGAKSRATDPETSGAAARVASRSCGRVAFRILAAMQDEGPMSDEQIGKLLPRIKSQSTIRGRRSDLVYLGYVERVDCAGKTSSGNSCTRWKITESGQEVVEKRFYRGAAS